MAKKSKNVIRYRKPMSLNIGVIVFVIIFIYLVFNVFSYLTQTHISVYEVSQGTIAVNNVYRGLALRTEKVYASSYSGALNYYVKEGTKTACGDLVYSVDESGTVAEKINGAGSDGTAAASADLTEIEQDISDFVYSYDAGDFYEVYAFRENIGASLTEALSVSALNDISDYVAAAEESNTFHKVMCDTPGIVVYYTDGFEDVTTDSFTADMFDESAYQKVNLKAGDSISAGGTAYKLIDSELWNIVVPIPDDVATSLKDGTVVSIRFLKDDKEMDVNYTLTERDGAQYLVLSLKSAMVRYATDRYIEIELLLSEETGLKIPNSAITQKEFFTIPVEYFLKGGDSNDEGLLVRRTDEEGESYTEFVSPTVYYETEKYYYVDGENLSAGDILQKPDSSETYAVGSDTAFLQGVYNINKGYAVFKQIDVLYRNGEYTIVKTGTTYGIALYDHIALDGTKISENQLISQ